ncbi:MAG: hypothetical protein JST19_02365 [Bacteroidetes bacterium]|nr:hypothetical protein [Bacteroidota bacterium]
MVLLSDVQDLSGYAAIGQLLLGVCGLVVLYQTFKLQAYVFLEQIKVTNAQLKIQDIEVERHRREIMPRFTLNNNKKSYRFPSLPEGFYIQELMFNLNDNPLVDFNMVISESVDYELYNGQPGVPIVQQNMNSKWAIGLQFKFESVDGGLLPKRTLAQSHLVFDLNFKDIRGNSYHQILVFVPELTPACFTNEPVLVSMAE